MRLRSVRSACAAAVVWLAVQAAAADLEIAVEATRPGHAISPRLYGAFFEDINFGADGGLSAELVKNGGLEFPRPLTGWREAATESASGRLAVTNDAPWRASNPNFLRITSSTGDFGAVNEGFRGIGVHGGETYRFSVQARTTAGRTARMMVRLVTPGGDTLAEAPVEVVGSDWTELQATLVPRATEAHAALRLTLSGEGQVDLDRASLYPERTWKNRPRGLRADLVQKLAELRPAFFRFPGGCIVEGSELKYRYQWKLTLGDPARRRLLHNRWNDEFAHRPTPDYYQSFALGFFEYFQLCDDLGAEPLPILNCGMACQFNSQELAPLDELEPFIQDALDLIEFANGPVESPWGARRAALGRPAPFNMKLLGVGNEQWGEQYFERYERFARVLKQRHPEIELVSGSGPFPVGKEFDYAWSRLRSAEVDVVDEHCYAPPDWFLREATRFDGYNRRGPKVFMGEYAAQSIDIVSPDNRNNLRCALAEAAFMTGLERNADVVAMSSYAPLFGHEEAWQWRPNLIWFDNLRSYATPNYYVQQLFAQHRGSRHVPVRIADAASPAATAAGRVGVGTVDAAAEFREITVARRDEPPWRADSLPGVEAMQRFRGAWELAGGVLRQTAPREATRALFGDCSWHDYTLSLKARKLAGSGGLTVYVRGTPGGSFLQWNIGAGRDETHALLDFQGRHSTESHVVAAAPGRLEGDRWYDVRVELAGPRVRCYLDGQLVHDVAVEPLALPRAYAVAGLSEQQDEVIVKVVHVGSEPAAARLMIDAPPAVGRVAKVIELSGDPEAVNSLDEPERIAPRPRELALTGAATELQLAPHSLTVLRVPLQ